MKTLKFTAVLFTFFVFFQAHSQVSVNVSIGAPAPVIYETYEAPVVYAPRPVYLAPRAVHVAPRPVYIERPTRVVYVKERHHKHKHHKKHGRSHKHCR